MALNPIQIVSQNGASIWTVTGSNGDTANPAVSVTLTIPSGLNFALSHVSHGSVVGNVWTLGALDANEPFSLSGALTLNGAPASTDERFELRAEVFGLDADASDNVRVDELHYLLDTGGPLGGSLAGETSCLCVDVSVDSTPCSGAYDTEYRLDVASITNGTNAYWDVTTGKGGFIPVDPTLPITFKFSQWCVPTAGGTGVEVSCGVTYTIHPQLVDKQVFDHKLTFVKYTDLSVTEVASVQSLNPGLDVANFCWQLLRNADNDIVGAIPYDCDETKDNKYTNECVSSNYTVGSVVGVTFPTSPEEDDVHQVYYDDQIVWYKYNGSTWDPTDVKPAQSGAAGADGADGDSAYQVAVNNGFVGTEAAWLASLVGATGATGAAGADGVDGADGADGADGQGISIVGSVANPAALNNAYAGSIGDLFIDESTGNGYSWNGSAFINIGPIQGPQGPQGDSAYDIAVANGFVGTEAAWLLSLNGTDGTNGTNGTNGTDGDSAYDVAVNNGFVGTEVAWLASLVGATGATGATGTAGTNGTNGTDGTNGTNGTDGDSAYDVAVNNGFVGTEAAWLDSLSADVDDPVDINVSLTTNKGTGGFTTASPGVVTVNIINNEATPISRSMSFKLLVPDLLNFAFVSSTAGNISYNSNNGVIDVQDISASGSVQVQIQFSYTKVDSEQVFEVFPIYTPRSSTGSFTNFASRVKIDIT